MKYNSTVKFYLKKQESASFVFFEQTKTVVFCLFVFLMYSIYSVNTFAFAISK